MQLVVCYYVVLVAESGCWPCVGESYLSSIISLVLLTRRREKCSACGLTGSKRQSKFLLGEGCVCVSFFHGVCACETQVCGLCETRVCSER